MTHSGMIRIAVVGGNRGFSYGNVSQLFPDKVELAAVCDLNEAIFVRWKEKFPDIRTFTSFERLLDDSSIDAVVLATPMLMHQRQAVQALKAGKHVICEVAAAHTLEGCWELVETVEQTGKVYMMSENYCYYRSNLLVRHMAEQGAFGQFTHAECGYIHDVRSATHKPDGTLQWRGELLRDYNGINYPTHSLGPIAQWLGINREGGDSFDCISTFVSDPASQCDHFRTRFGADHPGAQPDYWKQGDSALALIRTKGGAVIYMRNDFSSPRPHNYTHYGLQGTKGAFLAARHKGEDPLVWLAGRNAKLEWSSLWDYAEEFEHPLWKRSPDMPGEFFVMEEFVAAIGEGRQPELDVYDSAVWSSIFPLSVESAAGGGRPVAIPDFTINRPRRNPTAASV